MNLGRYSVNYRPGCTTQCGPVINTFSSIIKKILQYFSIKDAHFINESFIKIGRTLVETQGDIGLHAAVGGPACVHSDGRTEEHDMQMNNINII